ncbi:hypothetical protein [Paenibacillus bouchesdurhonensis]|uniref:hypothetical protein n=1 Tax=Paenibacillus bouchesdurhonensis TaxID=1870990 RepID=UPI000DA62923|nr:hypothetical protein [Paenibacillus bouchesdurhonensis]
MKAIVKRLVKHIFLDITLEPGEEIEVDDEETLLGNVQIIGPEKYDEMYISLEDIELVKEAEKA